MTIKKLFVRELGDSYQQSNASSINSFFAEDALARCRFQFFSVSTVEAVTNIEFRHRLGYIPLDILITGVSAGTASVNHELSTPASLFITTSTGCTVRMLVGRYV